MADSEAPSGDVFDVQRIVHLVELMKKHDLTEVNLQQGGQQIQLKRGGEPPAVVPPAYMAPAPMPPGAGQVPAAAAPPSASPAASEPPADAENITVIPSPMVGTYYAKANPEADSFIKVGDHVSPETVVCIIEAMKVFNEITAETSGEVVAILAENEDPVEYGQPLIKIDTSK